MKLPPVVRFPGYRCTCFENKTIRANTNRVFLILRAKGLSFFRTMTVPLISISLRVISWHVPYTGTWNKCLREIQRAANTTVELVFDTFSVVVYNRNRMESNKASSDKCGGVLHKGSSFLSFISLLLIVALFLRLESINSKTLMNELRISKVESHIEIGSPQTTNQKNEMETPEGKWTTSFNRHFQ